MQVTPNATSFDISPLNYGQKVTICVDGVAVQEFNIQQPKAKVSVYVNRLRDGYQSG